MVADESGFLSSDAASTSITVLPVNDEPPIVSNTPSVVVYTEQAGAVYLLDASTAIVDADNCLDHTLPAEVRVTLVDPLPEDRLLVNGSVAPGNNLSLSCEGETECFEEILTSLQYDNTNAEPNFEDRTVVVEVGRDRVCVTLSIASSY